MVLRSLNDRTLSVKEMLAGKLYLIAGSFASGMFVSTRAVLCWAGEGHGLFDGGESCTLVFTQAIAVTISASDPTTTYSG